MPLILYGELYTTYSEVTYNVIRKTEAVVDDKYLSILGDILIPTSGETPEEISRATCVMVPNVILAGDLLIFRPTKEVDGRILSFILNHKLNNKIASIAQGKSIVHIQASELCQLRVTFPTLPEQKKIASLLSSIDSTLNLCQRKLDLLTQAKKALVQQIFSRKLRFKADDGSDFPEWEEKKLGEIFTERVERSSTGELISVTINQGVVKSSDLDRRDNSSSDKSNYKVVRVGDIAYNSMRMWQGASGASQYSGILSPAYTVVIPRKGQDVSFWEYQFKSDLMLYRFTINSQGLTSDTWNLKYPLFSKISVQVPSLPEQQKIASCLSSADALINQARADLEQWREVKKSLLQQLFV